MVAVFSVFLAVSGLRGAETAADEAFSRLYFGLQPPTSRDVERAVELVEELIERERYSEAAPLIDDQLAAPTDQLDSSGKSLKGRLLRAIRGSGAEGGAALQAVLRGTFERRLAQARTAAELRGLVATHPPELFGTAGLVRLAEAEADRGAYSAATAAYLLAQDLDVARGREDRAQRWAERAAANRLRRSAGSDGGGHSPSLAASTATAAERTARLRAPVNWLGAGGDSRHQVVVSGGEPTVWRAWRVGLPVEEDPNDDDSRFHADATVAVDGLLVCRTADALLAIHAESGKRAWRSGMPSSEGRLGGEDSRPSKGIASDTRHVFAVTASQEFGGRNAWRASGRGRRVDPPNALAAFEIATGGKLRWRIDGGETPSELAGARFLGPPAPSEDRLYCLAEIEQSICLVQVDSETGTVEWVQPLMRSELGSPGNPARSSATPTVGERLVYCPTCRGAIVAVDPLLRRIAWVHYLRLDPGEARPPKQNGWRGFRGRAVFEDLDAWRHCRVIESEGRLIVVSPVSESLQVLDSMTGKQVWRRKQPGGWLLAAGHRGQVLTVDAGRVRSHDLETGEPWWESPLPPGDAPAGEGLLLEGRYLLPLQSGRLAMVDLQEAAATDRITLTRLGLNPLDEPVWLGDLLPHRGAVYSRSAVSIERFDQPRAGPSRYEQVDRLLAKGEPGEALEMLRDMPGQRDRRLAERRAVAMLRAARGDPSVGVAAAVELPELVAGPKAQAEAAVLRVRAASEGQDREAAAGALVDLAAGGAAGVVLSPETGWRVQATRLAWHEFDRVAAPDRTRLRQVLARLADPVVRRRAATRLAPMLAAEEDQPPSADSGSWPTHSDAWSAWRVDAQVELDSPVAAAPKRPRRRSRQPAARTRQPLRLADGAGGPINESTWSLEPRRGATLLTGANRWGEPLNVVNVPVNLNARTSAGLPRVGAAGDRLRRDRLALRLEEGFAVYRLDPEHAEEPLAWKSTSPPMGDWRNQQTDFVGQEEPVALGPWGVVSLAGTTLWCRDLETGERRWCRAIGSLGPGPHRVLAEGGELFVAARGERGGRFSAWSGAQSPEPWNLPPAKDWRAHTGGNLLVEGRSIVGRGLRLVPIRAARDADPVWQGEFLPKTVLHTTGRGLLLALTPDGELTVVDLRSGTERFRATLPGNESSPCRAIRAEEVGGNLLVEVDRSNPTVDRATGVRGVGGAPLLTGELHCLDAATGTPVWAGPAQVAAMSRLRTTIHDCPVLLLARRQMAETEGGSPTVALVALDPRTGTTVFRSDSLPVGEDTRSPEFLAIRRELGAQECLHIRIGRAWVSLRPTNHPAPPGPPLTARVETPADSGPKDIGRGFDRLIKSLFDDP